MNAPSTRRMTTSARLIDIRVKADPRAGVSRLDGVTLTVTSGTLAVVRGDDPGAVRSVLLAAAGRLGLEGGTVEVAGHRLLVGGRPFPEPWRRRVGLVRAHPALFDYLTIAENVALPAHWSGTHQPREHVARLTRTLGLEDGLDRFAGDLGDDERARVALAMALAYDPDLVVVEAGGRVVGDSSFETTASSLPRAVIDLVRLEGRTIVTDLATPAVLHAADQTVTIVSGRAEARRSA